ncbi:MAG: DUF5009 domain-containing protein [Planctomycetota bacterium]|nr:MAG: DUF5009 domain-containing protein [Planctomycetota bacterium]REK25576.1 MAG: DUF5009 domain-containing protein [Planctomycetota bacterium]REK31712.1 MAG: DUF5009 domain-containing protein [Planctomycetota bacterium]
MGDTYKISEQPGKGKPSSEVTPAKDALKGRANRPVGLTTNEERRLMAERSKPRNPGRLVSLDAYRGFIMLVLAANGFGIAAFAAIDRERDVWRVADYETWQQIGFHFDHPPWRSNFLPGFLSDPATPASERSEFLKICVSFWDLIQPAFMFMVGVAMPFSYRKRSAEGQSAGRRFGHAVWRGLVLVLMAVFLSSMSSPSTEWEFVNVLAQIGLGYVFVYLMQGWRLWMQLTAFAGILIGYWFFIESYAAPADYNFAARDATVEEGQVYPGRFRSWSKNGNAAHNVDFRLLNLFRTLDPDQKASHGIAMDATDWAPQPVRRALFAFHEPFLYNRGGYQTLNFVPSIATMLLGLICGGLLLSSQTQWKKLGILLAGGVLCMALSLVAAETVCPIVKRIWTPSWVLFSGAYVMWMLAGFYLLFDVLPLKALAFPLAIVGMNSIAVYLMGQLFRGWTDEHVVQTHLQGLLEVCFGSKALGPEMYGPIISATAVAFVFWLVILWMHRRRIYLRV